MPFKALTPSLSVSLQLGEADVARAAHEGFRAIIDNRPDGEEPDQPTAAEMQALAESHGMGFAHVPTVGGKISDGDVAGMADALTQAGAQPADALIATAAEAGYDLAALRPRFQTLGSPRADRAIAA